MKWKHLPIIKIYEALGSVADGRVEVSGSTGKVYSSTGNKFYDVAWDPQAKAIMANDNGSYWQGYLGYPGIAYLLQIGVLPYKPELAQLLKGVAWKDINQKFKNDFEKTLSYVLASLSPEQEKEIRAHVGEIEEEIKKLDLEVLGRKVRPPSGY